MVGYGRKNGLPRMSNRSPVLVERWAAQVVHRGNNEAACGTTGVLVRLPLVSAWVFLRSHPWCYSCWPDGRPQ